MVFLLCPAVYSISFRIQVKLSEVFVSEIQFFIFIEYILKPYCTMFWMIPKGA